MRVNRHNLVEHVQDSTGLVARTHRKALTPANGYRYQDVGANMEIGEKLGRRCSSLEHLNFHGLKTQIRKIHFRKKQLNLFIV